MKLRGLKARIMEHRQPSSSTSEVSRHIHRLNLADHTKGELYDILISNIATHFQVTSYDYF